MSRWQWTQLLAFEGFWLLAVAGQNRWAWLTALLLAAHFWFSPSRGADVRALWLAVPGLLTDAALAWAGVFVFGHWPLWLALLWAGFVLTLGHSLVWLRRFSPSLMAFTGALAGTSSYLAGWRLGAVQLPLGCWVSAAILVPVWATLLPLLVGLDRRLRRE
ncbi:DUF2878 domain-containing protein [Zobellella endophytica]|uniref:DUF2878 domain-containing protein n=1 Tax=Zobellella endophytica TaxID=2116700 RepID=A0A2P7R6E4_9GAMM|nr:DUF2878 domain-containing protein [Zobellella endophytica]PSJ45784.1 DUF2878 domain-containing protein [Zobellella endophytica]